MARYEEEYEEYWYDSDLDEESDDYCDQCGGHMKWCDSCGMYTRTCCEDYGDCMCC